MSLLLLPRRPPPILSTFDMWLLLLLRSPPSPTILSTRDMSPCWEAPPSKNLLHPNTSHVKEPLVPVWQWGIKCDRLIVEVEVVKEEDAVAVVEEEVLPLLQLLLLSRLLSDHREWSTTSSPWPSHPLILSFTHTQRQSLKRCLKPNIGGCFNLGNQVPTDACWWQLILDAATWCWGWF